MMTDKRTDQLEEPRLLKLESPNWGEKFAVAVRGVSVAITQEKSFLGHFLAAAVAIVAGFVLKIDKTEWCLVVLCMMAGLSTELLNSAIERLAKVITRENNPLIRDALDIASGAVFIITVGAFVLGLVVFAPKVGAIIFGPASPAP